MPTHVLRGRGATRDFQSATGVCGQALVSGRITLRWQLSGWVTEVIKTLIPVRAAANVPTRGARPRSRTQHFAFKINYRSLRRRQNDTAAGRHAFRFLHVEPTSPVTVREMFWSRVRNGTKE